MRRSRQPLAAVMLSLTALSLAAYAPAQNKTPPVAAAVTAKAVAKNYRKLLLITKEPVYVDPQFAMLCRRAAPSEVRESQEISGPHAHTAVRIFMNPLAASAFKRNVKTYPVGAIIVKEKTGMRDVADGVGGMIKRAPGYDPAHGDWEYFYAEDKAETESGRIASCVRCHDRVARTDHVYGHWGTHHPPLKPRFPVAPAVR